MAKGKKCPLFFLAKFHPKVSPSKRIVLLIHALVLHQTVVESSWGFRLSIIAGEEGQPMGEGIGGYRGGTEEKQCPSPPCCPVGRQTSPVCSECTCH